MIPIQHIHPIIVHFPIVLILLVAAYEVVATSRGLTVTGRTASGNFSVGLLVVAAVAAVAAYFFGDIALSYAEAGGFESDVAEVHETLGRVVAVSTSIWGVVRAVLWLRDMRIERPIAWIFPAVSAIGAGLIIWTAYYGGQLVFDLGVNVAKAAAGS